VEGTIDKDEGPPSTPGGPGVPTASLNRRNTELEWIVQGLGVFVVRAVPPLITRPMADLRLAEGKAR